MNNKIYNPCILKYLNIINDFDRNLFFKNAIEKYAKGKIVLDMGSGTGILSYYALKAGAKYVYSIEWNKISALLTEKVLSSHFDKSKYEVLNIDFWREDLSKYLKKSIDLLVTETIGPSFFEQGMIDTWETIRPYISDNFISIPDRLHLDLYQWNYELPLSRDWMNSNVKNDNLIIPNTLDLDFSDILLEINELSFYKKIKKIDLKKNELFNLHPDLIYSNILDYNFNNLPSYYLNKNSNSKCPLLRIPKIEFNISTDYHGEKTFGLVYKISFEDEILYLQELNDWYLFLFNIKESEHIKFKFCLPEINPDYWIYEIIK